jgi:hypothetical protein
MPPTACPLCDHTDAVLLGQVEGRDAFGYNCPGCGQFKLDAVAAVLLQSTLRDERYRLSAATRRASDAKHYLTIDIANAQSTVEAERPPSSLPELVNRLLDLIARRAGRYFGSYRVDDRKDYPLIGARDEPEFAGTFETAMAQGLITGGGITPSGWDRIEAFRKLQPDSRQAFVAMWFAKELVTAYEDGIRPGILQSNHFVPLRLDSAQFNGNIDDRIIAEIRRSAFVVADFTGNRGSVYFEAGYAEGLGIQVIYCCQADHLNGLQFDTRQNNHIVWTAPGDLREKLSARIAATVLPRPSQLK